MPTYTFRNNDSGEILDVVLRMSELDAYKENNPNLTRVFLEAAALGDPIRLGIKKPDAGFREVLDRIATRTPGGAGLKARIR